MAEVAIRRGQEGSRWINERPTGEDVASWFKENVRLHDGLKHEDYVTGITLIPANEKAKEIVGYRDNGTPVIEERTNVVYTPYPRVDTRIKYFHDLIAANEGWFGLIEPVEVPPQRHVTLPPGFFYQKVGVKDGKSQSFLCCTMKVTIYQRESFKENYSHQAKRLIREGNRILDAPPATKAVAITNRYGDADIHAMMKAETGAIGRALGMAGMLVVPGAGVATAEDMGDVDAPAPQPVAEEAAPEQPGAASGPTDDELREQAAGLVRQLQENAPDKFKEFTDWAKERGLGRLADTTSPALRGVVRQLERKLDEAVEATPLDEPDAQT
jgi:hypothetical protein